MFNVVKQGGKFEVSFAYANLGTLGVQKNVGNARFETTYDGGGRVIKITWKCRGALPHGFEKTFGKKAASDMREIIRPMRNRAYAKFESPTPDWQLTLPTVVKSTEDDLAGQNLTKLSRQRPADSPFCYSCGNEMNRAGSCYVCSACGTTSGLSPPASSG